MHICNVPPQSLTHILHIATVSSAKFSHCMSNTRHAFFLAAVCLCLVMVIAECLQVGVRRCDHAGLTCWPRAGVQGYKYCHHRNPEECRPERKRGTKTGIVRTDVGDQHDTKIESNLPMTHQDADAVYTHTHTQTDTLEFCFLGLGLFWVGLVVLLASA